MTDQATEKDVIAQAIADHQDSYEPDDLPTPFHGYAEAVIDALHKAGYVILPDDGEPTDCNCGWGGIHDRDNPRCDANRLRFRPGKGGK